MDAALADTARIYAVPRALVFAVMEVESAGRERALSKAGAVGLMQVMPMNASRVGLSPDDLVSALVAYNAGPHPKGTIPSNGETPAYVRSVLRALKRRR